MNTTINTLKRTTQTGLQSFLKDIGCNQMQFRLLYFWSRHPRAKLSLYTCCHALHASGNILREAITALVQKGILIATPGAGGLTTYALVQESCKEYIGEIARLDLASRKKLEIKLKGDNTLKFLTGYLNQWQSLEV